MNHLFGTKQVVKGRESHDALGAPVCRTGLDLLSCGVVTNTDIQLLLKKTHYHIQPRWYRIVFGWFAHLPTTSQGTLTYRRHFNSDLTTLVYH